MIGIGIQLLGISVLILLCLIELLMIHSKLEKMLDHENTKTSEVRKDND